MLTGVRARSARLEGVPEPPPDDELFDRPPSEFVAARNALVRRLRAAGDREAAGEVSRLRRPTQSVWALNQVARHEPDLIADLGDAGSQLRTATQEALDGDPSALRLAQVAERGALDRVIEAAEAHLSAGSERRNDANHQRMLDTLRATSTDAEAAALLKQGRLTEDLTSAGLGLEGFTGHLVPPTTRARGAQTSRRGTVPAGTAGETYASDEDAEEATARRNELAEARWRKLDKAASQAEAEASSAEAEADEARREADRAAAAAVTSEQVADRARERARQARTRADATALP